jgi:hypothetical protein
MLPICTTEARGVLLSSERIFNVLIYFEGGIAREYGTRHHRLDGPDAEKSAFLRAAVDADFPIARRFPLPRSFTVAEWLTQQRVGVGLGLFEESFAFYQAPRTPILCVTSIVDGAPNRRSRYKAAIFKEALVATRRRWAR